MYTFKMFFFLLFIIIILKIATNLFNKIYKFNDEKLNFTINVKAESINKMSQLEFEGFCKWFLENATDYVSIQEVFSEKNKDVNLILNKDTDESTYVKCIRFPYIEENESDSSKSIIGVEVCQRLVGLMVANNINHGIIITTGLINHDALDYVEQLTQNSNLFLEFITTKDIIIMLKERENLDDYSLVVKV